MVRMHPPGIGYQQSFSFRSRVYEVRWGVRRRPLAHLVRMHPPGAGHNLGVPGLAAAHARLTRLRDAQRRHCAERNVSHPLACSSCRQLARPEVQHEHGRAPSRGSMHALGQHQHACWPAAEHGNRQQQAAPGRSRPDFASGGRQRHAVLLQALQKNLSTLSCLPGLHLSTAAGSSRRHLGGRSCAQERGGSAMLGYPNPYNGA